MRQRKKWGEIMGVLGRFSACQDSFQTVGLGKERDAGRTSGMILNRAALEKKRKRKRRTYFLFSSFTKIQGSLYFIHNFKKLILPQWEADLCIAAQKTFTGTTFQHDSHVRTAKEDRGDLTHKRRQGIIC